MRRAFVALAMLAAAACGRLGYASHPADGDASVGGDGGVSFFDGDVPLLDGDMVPGDGGAADGAMPPLAAHTHLRWVSVIVPSGEALEAARGEIAGFVDLRAVDSTHLIAAQGIAFLGSDGAPSDNPEVWGFDATLEPPDKWVLVPHDGMPTVVFRRSVAGNVWTFDRDDTDPRTSTDYLRQSVLEVVDAPPALTVGAFDVVSGVAPTGEPFVAGDCVTTGDASYVYEGRFDIDEAWRATFFQGITRYADTACATAPAVSSVSGEGFVMEEPGFATGYFWQSDGSGLTIRFSTMPAGELLTLTAIDCAPSGCDVPRSVTLRRR